MSLKVWLDDDRDPLTDKAATAFWRDAVWVKTPEEAIDLLRGGEVTALSLDNDLALPRDAAGQPREGYVVANWLEEHTYWHADFTPPEVLNAHTGNCIGGAKINRAFESIGRILDRRE